MLASRLLQDASLRPDLFVWNGAIEAERLDAWLAEHAMLGSLPWDLITLWLATGGGDVFESETILGPFGDASLGDDIVGVNRHERARGMPARFVVVHTGMLTTAFDAASGDYVELADSDFAVLRRFGSLEVWYADTLRAEYRERYGLPAAG